MRHSVWVILVVVLTAVSVAVIAQDADPGPRPDGPPDRGPGADGPRGDRQPGARFLDQFDANGDGEISEGEWTDAFRKLDADHDGVVTQQELRKYAEQQRALYWKNLDKDEDGSISLEEWPGNERAFDRMDADGDGKISAKEIADMQERMQQWRQNRDGGGQGGGRRGGGRDNGGNQ